MNVLTNSVGELKLYRLVGRQSVTGGSIVAAKVQVAAPSAGAALGLVQRWAAGLELLRDVRWDRPTRARGYNPDVLLVGAYPTYGPGS